jgi:hypothetical protein
MPVASAPVPQGCLSLGLCPLSPATIQNRLSFSSLEHETNSTPVPAPGNTSVEQNEPEMALGPWLCRDRPGPSRAQAQTYHVYTLVSAAVLGTCHLVPQVPQVGSTSQIRGPRH